MNLSPDVVCADSPLPKLISTPVVTPSSPIAMSPLSNEAQVVPSPPRPTRKPRASKSVVWNYFEKLEINGVKKAKCLNCGQLMSGNTKNGTSHLMDHLTRRCNKKFKKVDIRQKVLNMNRKVDGTARVENSNFSQEVSRRELSTMVIMHEYPLSIVDHLGFRRFVTSLNPNFKIISRNTLRSDIMKMFVAEQLSLKKVLGDSDSRIAITTDLWTASNQKKGYMAVTAHYIDDFWMLKNLTLRFAYVPCPHTKETLAQVLLSTLNMYNIAEKVSSIVVDNCTTNDAMMDVLKPKFDSRCVMSKGNFLHMRCSAHILNLVVQDGLNVIGGAIEKIRDCVSFWTATPKRAEIFENKVRSWKLEFRKLSLDCKTRWNATYLMIYSALPYEDVFVSLKCQNSKLKFVVPSKNDWQLAREICAKLKIFHKATEIFSGRKYPTANLFFRQVCEIKLAIISWLSDDSRIVRDMALSMIEKFDKYWNSINGLLAIAAILDPRNKLECVEFYFLEIYGDEAGHEIARIKSLLREMMVEYQEKDNTNEVVGSSSSEYNVRGNRKVPSYNDECDEVADKWSQLKKSKTKTKKVDFMTELGHYLEEDALPDCPNFDILKFWNIELKYPTLRKIARDILAIPASTVASESAFSMGGRVVSPHRSRLHSNTIEALMCMQNWILGQYDSSTVENAHACASILEDADMGDSEGSGSASEVVDIDSDDDGIDDMTL